MKKTNTLLTRDEFREGVFKRDNHACVICGADAVDAHHIIERRLFSDGGYYLDNGSSLCGDCHMAAERTDISVEEIRAAIGIETPILPEDFYRDVRYDKWGNVYINQWTRAKGPLFFDESVQKILSTHLSEFSHLVKYPRTWHLPWSSGTKDDRILKDVSHFEGRNVVVTEKMDGENTSLYNDHVHARSLEPVNGSDHSWVKVTQSMICSDLPDGWRVCGENVYRKHSIQYHDLASYFLAFSIWDDRNVCLSWDATEEWLELFGLTSVPVLYRGIWDEALIKKMWSESEYDRQEGYVVRVEDSFTFNEFRKSIAKFVRPNHVQSSHHWKREIPVINTIKQGS